MPHPANPGGEGHPIPEDIKPIILAEAAWLGDQTACEKYGISLRSLQRLRRSVGTDVALLQSLEAKKRLFEKRWLEELDSSIGAAIRTIKTCADAVAADPRASKNPAVIHEIAGAVKLLADVKLANRVIDARLKGLERPNEDTPDKPSEYLLPGEIELAPGVIITSPELDEVKEAAGFTTESPSLIELSLENSGGYLDMEPSSD